MITDDDLGLGGYRFEDLQALRIVANRTDLNRKQNELGFPRPVKTGKSQALFLKAEVHDWLRQRAALRDVPTPGDASIQAIAPIVEIASPAVPRAAPIKTRAPPPDKGRRESVGGSRERAKAHA